MSGLGSWPGERFAYVTSDDNRWPMRVLNLQVNSREDVMNMCIDMSHLRGGTWHVRIGSSTGAPVASYLKGKPVPDAACTVRAAALAPCCPLCGNANCEVHLEECRDHGH